MAFAGYIIPHLSLLISSTSGGWFVSKRAGAERSEGVPSGHPACGCISGLLQDHGPGQDNLQSSFILHRVPNYSFKGLCFSVG